MNTCQKCQSNFEIYEQDKIFYEKVGVSEPTLCPNCRLQRRAIFRNEFNLYKTNCAKSGKEIVAMYRPDSNAVVYDAKAWWSDEWEGLDYAQDFDFSKTFTEQFRDLQLKVPRLALYGKNNENSDYTNHTEGCQNCYMCADTVATNTYYSKWAFYDDHLIDCYQVDHSSFCYFSQYVGGGNNLKFCCLSGGSSDSSFLYDCKNCQNCIFSYNLRNKEYYIENQPCTQEQYQQYIQNIDTGSFQNLETYRAKYEQMIEEMPHRFAQIVSCEDCTGDYINKSKDVQDSYGVTDCRDCRYIHDSGFANDCYDMFECAFDCELQYETHACNRGKNLISCSASYDVNNCYYSEMCHNSEELFGCIGLRHKKYCIFNKQYSKGEYFELKTRIIEHMKQTGEWGEFFHPSLSFFAYNESTVMEFVPLSKEQAIAQGFEWHEDKRDFKPATYELPDHVKDTPDSVCNETLSCQGCTRNYRIIKQELDFYRQQNIALPRKCFLCRYYQRIDRKPSFSLYLRNCSLCQIEVQSSYPPQNLTKILCESCYLNNLN